VLRGIRDEKARASVIVPFAPVPNSKAGELAAKFDIVMGFTPSA
jgi:protocatechuate 3,4-dioxygenase beta subunit